MELLPLDWSRDQPRGDTPMQAKRIKLDLRNALQNGQSSATHLKKFNITRVIKQPRSWDY